MREFWQVFQRGLPLTRQTFWKWIQIPVLLAGLAAIIGAPFGFSLIESLLLKTLVWIFLLMVIMIAAICIGLTPYWGQKEITKEHDQKNESFIESQDKSINEWRNKANALEQEIAKLRQK